MLRRVKIYLNFVKMSYGKPLEINWKFVCRHIVILLAHLLVIYDVHTSNLSLREYFAICFFLYFVADFFLHVVFSDSCLVITSVRAV